MQSVQLFAVQAQVDLDTYASADAFEATMRRHAERIKARREPDEGSGHLMPALAVWPENIATFLPLAGHAAAVASCKDSDAAMRRVAIRAVPTMLKTAVRFRPRSLNALFLTAMAPAVWKIWWGTFSRIAADFELWVVAGSALVPENALGRNTGEFRPAGARVYNTSLTFAPDGRCVSVVRKVNLVPTQEDVLDLSAGDAGDLEVVDTPFGRLGTLICYDGFDEAHTADEPCFTPGGLILDGLGADVIAQPSANAWDWNGPWFFNEPGESQLRSEQWFNEGMYRHMERLTHVRYTVNPQLVGTVFEHHFEAPSLIIERAANGGVRVAVQSEDPYGEDLISVTARV
ncbi:MAG: carbon-nitrogen hydrolase family protein [Acidimicrobiia bacterium]|nr:carbon-nitrogen hydrolase family protein [Acidimicrobiia bacterium]